jgi:hypothetical protein
VLLDTLDPPTQDKFTHLDGGLPHGDEQYQAGSEQDDKDERED